MAAQRGPELEPMREHFEQARDMNIPIAPARQTGSARATTHYMRPAGNWPAGADARTCPGACANAVLRARIARHELPGGATSTPWWLTWRPFPALIWGRTVPGIFIGAAARPACCPTRPAAGRHTRLRLDAGCEVTLEANPAPLRRSAFAATAAWRHAPVGRRLHRHPALGAYADRAHAVEETASAFNSTSYACPHPGRRIMRQALAFCASGLHLPRDRAQHLVRQTPRSCLRTMRPTPSTASGAARSQPRAAATNACTQPQLLAVSIPALQGQAQFCHPSRVSARPTGALRGYALAIDKTRTCAEPTCRSYAQCPAPDALQEFSRTGLAITAHRRPARPRPKTDSARHGARAPQARF